MSWMLKNRLCHILSKLVLCSQVVMFWNWTKDSVVCYAKLCRLQLLYTVEMCNYHLDIGYSESEWKITLKVVVTVCRLNCRCRFKMKCILRCSPENYSLKFVQLKGYAISFSLTVKITDMRCKIVVDLIYHHHTSKQYLNRRGAMKGTLYFHIDPLNQLYQLISCCPGSLFALQ